MRDLRADRPAAEDGDDIPSALDAGSGVHRSLSDLWVDDPDDWGVAEPDPDDATNDASVDQPGEEPDEETGPGSGELSDDEPSGIKTSGDDALDTQIPDEPRDATDDPAAGREPPGASEQGDDHDSSTDPKGHADTGTERDGRPDRPRFYVVDRPDVPEDRTGGYGDPLTYRDGTLIRPPLFDGPPKRTDAIQGILGDCGVIAVMGSVAHHQPEAITDLVRARDDGTVEVRFHQARAVEYGTEPTGERTPVIVTPQVPVRIDNPDVAAFANSHRAGVAWPAMLEKACAGIDITWPEDELGAPARGYTRLDGGTHAMQRAELVTQFTGRPADIYQTETGRRAESRTEETLRSLLDADCPIIVATKPSPDRHELPHRLQGSHAYEVTAVDDGMVTLHNPWGFRQPPPLAMRDFLHNLQRYYTALRPEEDRP